MNTIKLNTIGTPCKAGGNAGGGGGSASSWRYYDLTSASSQPPTALIGFCSLVKTEGLDNDVIGPSGASLSMPSVPSIKAMAFETSLLINSDGMAELITLGEYLDNHGILSAMMPQGATEITKEEFYTL